MQKLSYENKFDLHKNELLGGTHFYMNGFTHRLVLTPRQKGTQKWPIHKLCHTCCFCLIAYRYGGRYRDDRGHRGYDDRQKPATEYGSRGFYEYFY